jgi:D-threonate/D-erythronate kinase
MPTRLVIVADDLTGAADSGAPFATAGLSTAIQLGPLCIEDVDVLVFSTEGRELPGPEAAKRVRDTVEFVQRTNRPSAWFKKIDSVLRGHPELEIAIMMDALGVDRVLVTPALPSEGRVTIGGEVIVRGQPLHQSDLSDGRTSSRIRDGFQPLHPAPVIELPLELIRGPIEELSKHLCGSDPTVYIADAETEADLDLLATGAVAGRIPLLAGSAGLARALANAIDAQGLAPLPQDLPGQPPLPVLIVAGSRHGACQRQLEAAAETGVAIERLPTLDRPLNSDEASGTSQRLVAHLAHHRHAALTTVGLGQSAMTGDQIADQLARVATDPCVLRHIGGMILTGGDVAAAVCRRLKADHIRLGGEVLPAIPWGMLEGPACGRLPVVTKAGSFGSDDALVQSVAHLQSLSFSQA